MDVGGGTTGRVMAWLDVSAGVAGDMLLGALVDAGASLEVTQAAVDAVIPATVRLVVRETSRSGMRALKVDVELLAPDQHHRHWSEIRDRLAEADLDESVREQSLAVFRRLAVAEARVHGTAVDDVHFHEVGAWDSIADVVGCCAALVDLGVETVTAGRMSIGSGSVRAAHGRVPVPVPAVLELCRGWDVDSDGDGELATPTGAALVTALASQRSGLPAMSVSRVGVGAGTRERPDRANVVRVVIGTTGTTGTTSTTGTTGTTTGIGEETSDGSVRMCVLEANVDDLDPRLWPTVIDGLLAAGAADAWMTPITMKRGRPALLLSVLSAPGEVATLRDLVFATTSTIGIRVADVGRWALPRGWAGVSVDGRRVAIKVAHDDGRIVNAAAEFRQVESAAAVLERPVREVLDAAQAAASAAGLVRGAKVPDDLRPAP